MQPLARTLLVSSLFGIVSCAGSSASQTARSRYEGHRATMSALGFHPVGEVAQGSIVRGQTVRQSTHLEGGKCYRIVALGNGSALDLEIALVADGGQRAVASESSGPDASVRYCPARDSDFGVTLSARSGNGTYEFGVWEDRASTNESSDDTQRGTCEAPIVLEFGHPLEGSTANARDNASGTCLRGHGPDVIYSLALPTRRRVTITVRTDFDAALYLQHDCGADQSSEISCCNLAIVRGVSRIDTVLDAGNYFVVVDSVENGRRGRFTLEAQMGEAPELAQVCAGIPVLTPSTPGHPTQAVHASTSGRPDLMRGTCAEGHFPGPDQAYALRLAEPSRVRATVTAEGEWDTALYVRRSCSSEDTEVACNDDAGDAQHARITKTLDAGQYTIVVDGYVAGSQGEYALEVEMAPSAGSDVPSDTCAGAAALPLDGSIDGDTFAAHDDLAGSCGGDGSPDVVYRITVPRRAHVSAELTRAGLGEAAASSRLYFVHGCGVNHGEVACGRARVDAVLSPGNWYLVIDGATRDDFGRFTLQTHTDDGTGIDAACHSVTVLTPGEPVRGTTSGADRLHGSCGNRAQSPERVYALRLTERRHVSLAVQAEYDSVLYLRSACDRESSEIACNDDDTNQRTSRIETDLDVGTYYVVVDGFYRGNNGAFTLTAVTSDPHPAPPVTLGSTTTTPTPTRQPAPRDGNGSSGIPALPVGNPCNGGGPGNGR